MTSKFSCPVCSRPLKKDGSSLLCENRHSFDIAKEGYVNLALGKSDSGDNPDMCRGRHDFLSADYYLPFASEIANECIKNSSKNICDAGCGEGYYLRKIKEIIPCSFLVGLDLAKTSVKIASKSEKGKESPISYAVAGIFDMPLPDNSFDTVLSVFAPVPEDEAHRILTENGTLIVCHPGKMHLMGLKRHLYDNPYENEEKDFVIKGFEHKYDTRVSYKKTVKAPNIKNLFLMTPYYFKTSKIDSEKLNSLSELETELEFIISVYKKI